MKLNKGYLPNYEDAITFESDGRLYFGDIAQSSTKVDAEVGKWLAFMRTDEKGIVSLSLLTEDLYGLMLNMNKLTAEKDRWDGMVTSPEELEYARSLKHRFEEAQFSSMMVDHTEDPDYHLTTGVFHVSKTEDIDPRELAKGPRKGFSSDDSIVGSFVYAMAHGRKVSVDIVTNLLTGEVSALEFTTK